MDRSNFISPSVGRPSKSPSGGHVIKSLLVSSLFLDRAAFADTNLRGKVRGASCLRLPPPLQGMCKPYHQVFTTGRGQERDLAIVTSSDSSATDSTTSSSTSSSSLPRSVQITQGATLYVDFDKELAGDPSLSGFCSGSSESKEVVAFIATKDSNKVGLYSPAYGRKNPLALTAGLSKVFPACTDDMSAFVIDNTTHYNITLIGGLAAKALEANAKFGQLPTADFVLPTEQLKFLTGNTVNHVQIGYQKDGTRYWLLVDDLREGSGYRIENAPSSSVPPAVFVTEDTDPTAARLYTLSVKTSGPVALHSGQGETNAVINLTQEAELPIFDRSSIRKIMHLGIANHRLHAVIFTETEMVVVKFAKAADSDEFTGEVLSRLSLPDEHSFIDHTLLPEGAIQTLVKTPSGYARLTTPISYTQIPAENDYKFGLDDSTLQEIVTGDTLTKIARDNVVVQREAGQVSVAKLAKQLLTYSPTASPTAAPIADEDDGQKKTPPPTLPGF